MYWPNSCELFFREINFQERQDDSKVTSVKSFVSNISTTVCDYILKTPYVLMARYIGENLNFDVLAHSKVYAVTCVFGGTVSNN